MNSAHPFLKTLQNAPDGLSVAQLLLLHSGVSRRTAQRYLAQLVAVGFIQARGEGRGRRYWAVDAMSGLTQTGWTAPEWELQHGSVFYSVFYSAQCAGLSSPVFLQVRSTYCLPTFPDFIPLSADSRDIVKYVDLPVAMRKPVAYQREFLESYRRPNETWYSPESLRRQLALMGATVDQQAPAGTFSRAILNRLLIDLSWALSRLEGNTYSRLDTLALIEHGAVAQGKTRVETQMILNHKSAIELLVENIEAIGFDHYTLLNLHIALSENLLANPADEGRLRQHVVEIGMSVFHPLPDPYLIAQMFDLLLVKVNAIQDPFEQVFFMMVHLPYLQAFADMNKRTSRLAANLPLFRVNLCPLTFLDVPEQAYSRAILGVYELTRVELLRDVFVWSYERSTQEYLAIKQNLAEPDPIRLQYRQLIKQAVRDIVLQPMRDPVDLVQVMLVAQVTEAERAELTAVIFQELRRLHEGVLARYGLRPPELKTWKNAQAQL